MKTLSWLLVALVVCLAATRTAGFCPAPVVGKLTTRRALLRRLSQETTTTLEPLTTTSEEDALVEDDEDDEVAAKKREIARLKAAEKFIEQGTGVYLCKVCAYKYDPELGDATANIPVGTQFADLPASWRCPTCRAQKDAFEPQVLKIAGFAENQNYGLGGNTMTEEGKSGLIFGSLAAFFLLFMAGYLLN